MSDEKKDFVVKDRRVFSEEDSENETQDTETAAGSVPEDETTASSTAEDDQATEAHQEPPLPAINFSTFVVSLNASALLNLGAIEDPATGQTNKDLAMAKQTIDILSMLEEKTAGNLSTEESNLLKSILYDLRIIYVKESG
ncbi:hypothetical protein JY97_15190 [Alkalispirochaeta odontotermitis]|nr:hypothetical protein JY97_15190 [Alkalispirochaeta odontotermitis]CAB1085329.1 hypothetical protein D1AOALGA4SA_12817 [Olavius algarvensis Delta 1 endosymbiont]